MTEKELESYDREPWGTARRDDETILLSCYDPTGEIVGGVAAIGVIYSHDICGRANAARIVACVNACAGIPTSALEAGVVRELADALRGCTEQMEWPESGCPAEAAYDRAQEVLAKLKTQP